MGHPAVVSPPGPLQTPPSLLITLAYVRGHLPGWPPSPFLSTDILPTPPGGPPGASASKPSPGDPCQANLRPQLTAQLLTPISPWILVCQEAGLKPNTAPHHLAQQPLLARVPPYPGLLQTSRELT